MTIEKNISELIPPNFSTWETIELTYKFAVVFIATINVVSYLVNRFV